MVLLGVSHVAIVCQWPMLQIQEGFTSTQSTCVTTDETLFLCPCLCCCCFLTLCFYHKTEGSQDLFIHSSELAVSPHIVCGLPGESRREGSTYFKVRLTAPHQDKDAMISHGPTICSKNVNGSMCQTEFRHYFEGNSHWKIGHTTVTRSQVELH